MKALLFVAAVPAVADPPYLPASGPVPLRFSHPVVRKTPAVQLPPLATIEPRPAQSLPALNAEPKVVAPSSPPDHPPPPAPNEPVAPAVPELVSLPPTFNPVVTNGIEFVRPDTENLTPQMFMKFFSGRPGTNASGLTIIAPMPFVPPAPPAPSSTATFQTTPPAKP